MNHEHNELNDIILNRNEKSGTRKKMLIGIGTLAIVAIVIVIIMGSISGSTPVQLPEAAVQMKKPTAAASVPATSSNALSSPSAAQQHLEAVTEQVKASAEPAPVPLEKSGVVVIGETIGVPEVNTTGSAPAKTTPAHATVSSEPLPVTVTAQRNEPPKKSAKQPETGSIYIQVGSFSRYQPDKAFLAGIERHGYTYTIYRAALAGKIKNKVLIGPFKDRNDAKAHLADIRRKIESGAFIYTIKP